MPETHWDWSMPVTFSQGWKTGDLVVVGGQISADEKGRTIGAGDIATQTRNAMEFLKRVLEEAGASMQDVVKTNVYYRFDGDEHSLPAYLDEIDKVRLDYFSEPGPVSTETRVPGLAYEGLLVEIDAYASVGAERQRLMPQGHWGWGKPPPFSHGWKVGDLIFVGAQASLDSKGELIGAGDVAAQTRNVFENLQRVLREGGAGMSDLVRLNTYYRYQGEGREITDHWERMTQVRMEYLPEPGPVGTAVRVAGFPRPGELIQIEGIAHLGRDRRRIMPKGHWDWSMPVPFSQGWKIGDMVFVGGQISSDEKGRTLGAGDIAAQTRNVFRFIEKVLSEAGAAMRDVLKLNTYYHFDGENLTKAWEEMTKVRMEYLPNPGPAATAVRVDGFAYEDLLIEVEAIAVVDRRS